MAVSLVLVATDFPVVWLGATMCLVGPAKLVVCLVEPKCLEGPLSQLRTISNWWDWPYCSSSAACKKQRVEICLDVVSYVWGRVVVSLMVLE